MTVISAEANVAAERAMAVTAAMDASFLIGLFSNIGCVETTGGRTDGVGIATWPGGSGPYSTYGQGTDRDAAVVKKLLPSGENRTGIDEQLRNLLGESCRSRR
jgi:hypothetical protein